MLQSRLALLPNNAVKLSDQCALVREEGQLAIFNSAGVIFMIVEGDRQGMRTAQGMLCALALAKVSEVATAFDVARSTVRRNRDLYLKSGVEGLSSKRGPRGGCKMNEERLAEAQRWLDNGRSICAAARAVGVSHTALRYALDQGWLQRKRASTERVSGSQPSARSAVDAQCEGGVGVKRNEERLLAAVGELEEAPVCFEASSSVVGAGVLLALPALLSEGLMEVTESVYGRLEGGFFGLRSVLLTLIFMALLRIKSIEQLKGHAPGEWGLLLGLDRAPEMKTLRRKLKEIGARGSTRELADAFARRWAQDDPETLGFLYVDGHVRPYHGRKHWLPKTFVPRRRLCMPATTDMWVNDAQAQPWFVVTTPANDGLLSVLEKDILPDIREQVGAERRVTMVFDREGWSPKAFKHWFENGFDVMTYRKGSYQNWPEEEFVEVEDPTTRCGSSPVVYRLAERETLIGQGGILKMREVRRLCDNGHQTSIVTTRQDLPSIEVASRMFARWRQENFFRYMRHEYALDHLCTYQVEPADPARLMPNPERKDLRKERDRLTRQVRRLEKKRDKLEQSSRPDNETPKQRDKYAKQIASLTQSIEDTESRIEDCTARFNATPPKLTVGEVLEGQPVVKLETERTSFTDLIKMIAYRAESTLFTEIAPLLTRNTEEGRTFLKAVFQTAADMLPNYDDNTLVLRFHSMAQPRFNRVLAAMCEAATVQRTTYPGTNLRLVFEGPQCSI